MIFSVAQDYLTQIQPAQRQGHLRVDALDRAQSATLATGVLTAVDNQIDTTTGTVRLRARFENKNGELFPNQFVNTRLLVRTVHDAVLIPVRDSAQRHKAFVYVIAGNACI